MLPGHYDHPFGGSQACFKDLAIQYAMVAAGALHECITSNLDGNLAAAARQRIFSIQQYDKAIKNLTSNTAHSPATEFVLTACIVFIAFENLAGRSNEALKHLKNGIAMLQSWKPGTNSEMVLKQEYLTPIYTRGNVYEAPVSVLTVFENLQAARQNLQMLLDMIYPSVDSSVISGDKLAADADILRARNLLKGWYTKFALLENPKDIEQRRATTLLRLQYVTAIRVSKHLKLLAEYQSFKVSIKYSVPRYIYYRTIFLEGILGS